MNDLRVAKVRSASVEESIIGINASWVVPNKYVDHEGMVNLLQNVRGTRSLGSAAIEISYVVTGKIGCLYVHAIITLGYCRRNGYCKRGRGNRNESCI